MNFDKRCYMAAALALTGCAVALSACVRHQSNRRAKARELQNALEVWENEGGIVPSSKARSAEVR